MRALTAGLALFALCACSGDPAAPPEQPAARGTRRVSIAHLRRTFPAVFGNDLAGNAITWMSPARSGFDVYSRALGEPDYLDTVDENLDPSPLYVKFLDDAARDACGRALSADFGRPDMAQRTLLRHVALTARPDTARADVDRNLRYLRLRFHGVRGVDGDDPTLAPYRDLLAAGIAANNGSVREGWRAVCVALVTAPEFSLY